MRVFLTGATGVLGRRALPLLVEAGHSVTAVARSPQKAAGVRAAGAAPVEVDLLDPAAVARAVTGHDAVVHLATHIPSPVRAVRASAWATNDALRRDASRHLVDAALAGDVGRYVQESIAFVYLDCGARWVDEDTPTDPPPLAATTGDAEEQARRFSAAGRTGVVLRFGQFYAPDSAHTQFMAGLLRRRLPALPGPPDAYASAVSADDAASAVRAALEVPAGTWNVVDEPMTRADFHAATAEALGVRPPLLTLSAPLRLAKSMRFYLRSQRVSNGRFRAATGWLPRQPDAGAGWRAMFGGG